jgi:hypothetical protein
LLPHNDELLFCKGLLLADFLQDLDVLEFMSSENAQGFIFYLLQGLVWHRHLGVDIERGLGSVRLRQRRA